MRKRRGHHHCFIPGETHYLAVKVLILGQTDGNASKESGNERGALDQVNASARKGVRLGSASLKSKTLPPCASGVMVATLVSGTSDP